MREYNMTTKTTFLLLGVCIGAAAPLIAKAARPLAAYALAGGMLAYETACDAIESSKEAYLDRFKKKPG
jgi:hypothetical protein